MSLGTFYVCCASCHSSCPRMFLAASAFLVAVRMCPHSSGVQIEFHLFLLHFVKVVTCGLIFADAVPLLAVTLLLLTPMLCLRLSTIPWRLHMTDSLLYGDGFIPAGSLTDSPW